MCQARDCSLEAAFRWGQKRMKQQQQQQQQQEKGMRGDEHAVDSPAAAGAAEQEAIRMHMMGVGGEERKVMVSMRRDYKYWMRSEAEAEAEAERVEKLMHLLVWGPN